MTNLNMLDGWAENSLFSAKTSAQSYFRGQAEYASVGPCGSSCGAGGDEKPEEKPSACGSSCGAGDADTPSETPKPETKPSACGSSCGAGN
jgi:ACGX-repeat protein